jgi:hypothetical protein
MTPGTLLLRMANALSVRIALPSLSQRMASMMSNPPDLPVTARQHIHGPNGQPIHPPHPRCRTWCWNRLQYHLHFLGLVATCFHRLGALCHASAAPHHMTWPQTHCKPSVKHKDHHSPWTPATCKATHSWVNGTATCMIQTNHVPPVSVFAVCSGRVGSTSSSGRRQFTVILHRHMCPSQHDRTVSECKRSLYS